MRVGGRFRFGHTRRERPSPWCGQSATHPSQKAAKDGAPSVWFAIGRLGHPPRKIQDFDANIKKDLQSKDPSVRAAAAVYGSFNDGNKVNIRFDPNAKAPGEGKQDRDASGKRLDSTTITFKGMTKDSSGRALVAHEGSHVEDFQSFIAGGAK